MWTREQVAEHAVGYHPAAVCSFLDVGRGSGDLSIYLAGRGYETLGIDFVEAAIAGAQEKLNSLPRETAGLLRFQVADALKPTLLGRQFGAIVDE